MRPSIHGTAIIAPSTQADSVLDENLRNAQSTWRKLDPERVRAFIAAQPEVAGRIGEFDLTYPAAGQGISNGIAFITAHIDMGGGPVPREWVVRYAPGTMLLKQKSFSDEYLTMQCLARVGVPAPRALWLDAAGERLGAPGYVMERIRGDIPASSMFTAGLLAEASSAARHEMMLEAAGFHGRLKRASLGADVVPHLLGRGAGADPVAREANWWMEEARLNLRRGDDRLARIEAARTWLLARRPGLRAATLVHGDSQLCNLIYSGGKVRAALDWELAYLGHGEADLAIMIWLTHLQQSAAPHLEGVPTENEFIARFESESAAPLEHFPYLRLFALYKLVAVLTASAHTMPGFNEFWEMNWSELERAWASCRAQYGA